MILDKFRTNKIELGIYTFLDSFDKSNDYKKSKQSIIDKLNCDDKYANFIIGECDNSNYFSGLSVNKNCLNQTLIDIRENLYVTRDGYKFIHQYELDNFNFFWIPFKTFFLILATAIITVIINNCFSNSNQSINIVDDVTSQKEVICEVVCDDTNN